LSDSFAETLDVFALAHQNSYFAVEGPACRSLRTLEAHDRSRLWFDMVGTHPLVRDGAFTHQVGECVDVAAGLPDSGMHDDGGVEAHDVVALPGHRSPPGVTEVALQFSPQRAVVPEAADPAVDLGRLEDDTTSLAEADDLLHTVIGFRWFGHGIKRLGLLVFGLLARNPVGFPMQFLKLAGKGAVASKGFSLQSHTTCFDPDDTSRDFFPRLRGEVGCRRVGSEFA